MFLFVIVFGFCCFLCVFVCFWGYFVCLFVYLFVCLTKYLIHFINGCTGVRHIYTRKSPVSYGETISDRQCMSEAHVPVSNTCNLGVTLSMFECADII